MNKFGQNTIWDCKKSGYTLQANQTTEKAKNGTWKKKIQISLIRKILKWLKC